MVMRVNVNVRHHANPSWQSVKPLPRCGDFSTFSQNGGLLTSSVFKFSNCQRSTRLRGSTWVSIQVYVTIRRTAEDIWRFFDFSKWRQSAVLVFKYSNFNGQHVGGSKYAYPYQISLRSVEPLLRCNDPSIFQDGVRRHLEFLKFDIFNSRGRLERVQSRCHAKFGRNRSNCGRDMASFRFFKMAATAILDFQKFETFNGRTAQ